MSMREGEARDGEERGGSQKCWEAKQVVLRKTKVSHLSEFEN